MGDGVYKISTLAKLTGFGIQAIRNWEVRYGLLQPERTDGGHRLYSEADLRKLRRIKELLAKGRSIGEIANILQDERPLGSHEESKEPKQNAQATLSRYVGAPSDRVQLDALLAENVLDALPHGVVITDTHGKTEWINQGVVELCGYTLSELRGRTPGSVLQGPETDRKVVRRMSKALAARSACSEQILNYDAKNRRYLAAVDIAPVWQGQRFRGFVGLIRDLTRQGVG